MSRNTVDRLLSLRESPRYARPAKGSQLLRFAERIAELLSEDPSVRATVLRERLRGEGYGGGITILQEHLARVRPAFLAARAFQRTSYGRARSARSTGGTRASGCPSGGDGRGTPSGSSRRCPSRPPTP